MLLAIVNILHFVRKSDSYLKLPYDLSGSMSKNRFRNEMLWGLEKMFELYRTNQDFFMVFDYVCDIEAHLNGKIEFFQIKTNNAAKPYSINKIAKPDKSGKLLRRSAYGRLIVNLRGACFVFYCMRFYKY